MYVKDWMTTDLRTMAPDSSLFDAKGLMGACKIRHLPIVHEGRVVGLLSQTDVLHASAMIGESIDSAMYHKQMETERVDSHMSKYVIEVDPDTPIEDAATIMRDKKIGCVIVTDGTELVGILTQTDLFDILVRSLGEQAGGAREVFDLDPDDEQATLNAIGAWLAEGGRRLRHLTTYAPRDGETAKVVVRAQEPGDA